MVQKLITRFRVNAHLRHFVWRRAFYLSGASLCTRKLKLFHQHWRTEIEAIFCLWCLLWLEYSRCSRRFMMNKILLRTKFQKPFFQLFPDTNFQKTPVSFARFRPIELLLFFCATRSFLRAPNEPNHKLCHCKIWKMFQIIIYGIRVMTLWPQVQRAASPWRCCFFSLCTIHADTARSTRATKMIQNEFVYLNLWLHKFSRKAMMF